VRVSVAELRERPSLCRWDICRAAQFADSSLTAVLWDHPSAPTANRARATVRCRSLRCLNAGNTDHSESLRGRCGRCAFLLHGLSRTRSWLRPGLGGQISGTRQRRGRCAARGERCDSVDRLPHIGRSVRCPRGLRAGGTAGVRDRSSADYGGVGGDTLLRPIATRCCSQCRRARLDHRAARSRSRRVDTTRVRALEDLSDLAPADVDLGRKQETGDLPAVLQANVGQRPVPLVTLPRPGHGLILSQAIPSMRWWSRRSLMSGVRSARRCCGPRSGGSPCIRRMGPPQGMHWADSRCRPTLRSESRSRRHGGVQCAVHGRLTGTLANPVPDWGFTQVGASVAQEFMAVYEITGDQMSYIRVCLNPAVSARQVGPA